MIQLNPFIQSFTAKWRFESLNGTTYKPYNVLSKSFFDTLQEFINDHIELFNRSRGIKNDKAVFCLYPELGIMTFKQLDESTGYFCILEHCPQYDWIGEPVGELYNEELVATC